MTQQTRAMIRKSGTYMVRNIRPVRCTISGKTGRMGEITRNGVTETVHASDRFPDSWNVLTAVGISQQEAI